MRTLCCALFLLTTGSVYAAPTCQYTASDPDNDGWGWENDQTCRVSVYSSTQQPPAGGCLDSDQDGWGWDGQNSCRVEGTEIHPNTSDRPTCSTPASDPDGDGFGWENNATCLVTTGTPTTPTNPPGSTGICVDDDGDGWGWNGSSTCRIFTGVARHITDVVLMMGQSNALGEDTEVDYINEDAPSDRIVVWTQFEDWQVADLCSQKWQKGWFPWRGGKCSNHPAFQIAKHIVELDNSRKVAIIPTGSAGKPISWWSPSSAGDREVVSNIERALAQLPQIDNVNMIAWAQGESDHGNEGNWAIKLDRLIEHYRSKTWFDRNNSQFIAIETKTSSVNRVIQTFEDDADDLTKWVKASDLTTKDGVHWSAPALRTIGERTAREYLDL